MRKGLLVRTTIVLTGAIVVSGLVFAVIAQSTYSPLRLGRAATVEEVKELNITVLPNGEGLPVGSGSVQRGREIYERSCAVCHGLQGKGNGEYPALVGGIGSLKSDKPVLTIGSYWPYATTVWDYTRRSMPYERPGTLSDDEVYAVTAYLLKLNNIVGETESLDQNSLPRVQMPNRNGFVQDPRPDIKAKR